MFNSFYLSSNSFFITLSEACGGPKNVASSLLEFCPRLKGDLTQTASDKIIVSTKVCPLTVRTVMAPDIRGVV